MGVTTAPQWSQALIANGKSPATPAAIVRRASFPDQHTTYTTLGKLGSTLKSIKLRPPAIVVVGDVAREREAANWFTSRPLFGQTVLVTRPAHQGVELIGNLSELGARVLCQPAIEISEPSDWSPVDAIVRRLGEFHWLVFSSSNGVHYFLRRLLETGYDLRHLGSARLAVIGPATGDALSEYHLRADLQATEYRAETLATALATLVHGQRVFLARASRGREVLAEMLTAAGAEVEQAIVYESCDVTTPGDEVSEALAAGGIHWTTATSSAIAHSLVRLFGATLRKTRLVAISPLTADVLTELGHPPALIADQFTSAGIVAAILAAQRHKP
jgi:uroporphyrinogen III methyltransferase/synthase